MEADGDTPRFVEILETAQARVRKGQEFFSEAEQLVQQFDSTLTQPVAPDVQTGPRFAFKRDGNLWRVVFDEKVAMIEDSRGMKYIHLLVCSPHKHINALHLAQFDAQEANLPPESATEVTDAKTLKTIRTRIDDLEEFVQTATDPCKKIEAADELRQLRQHLQSDTKKFGQVRRTKDTNEKARQSVTKAIRRTLNDMEASSSPAQVELVRHLKASLKLGTNPIYSPHFPIPWEF